MRSTGVDITEESKQRELLTKCGLKHLKDGEAEGSLRSVLSEEEGEYFEWEDGKWQERQYQLGEGAVAFGSYTQASGQYAHAEGLGAKATGEQAHAEGLNTTARGNNSHAEGANTTASGSGSHSEGDRSTASGFCSHAEGNAVTASGDNSHAEGISTVASGSGSHAEGNMSKAIGMASHAAGVGTTAQGDYSHAEGNTTTAIGEASHTEGRGTTASGDYSHAEGQETIVQEEAIGSHAEGYQTVVHGEVTHEDGTTTKGDYAHAEGENTQAYGRGSHAEGYQCVTKNNFAHAEGNVNIAEGFASHAEGGFNTAKGQYSHAEGNNNFANAMSSHAEGSNNTIAEGAYYGHAEGERNTIEGGNGVHVEGNNNKVNGQYAHAEGQNTVAEGLAAHAEGWGTTASTTGSPGAHAEGVSSKALELAAHAEGQETTASGVASHAEGNTTTASGPISHAEGAGTTASGAYSHAEGQGTTASGAQSHAEGLGNKAEGDCSHAEGTTTTASGNNSHAEGAGSKAVGSQSHAEGAGSTANGAQSHAEGGGTTAGGAQSHAEGGGSQALGDNSHAEGASTVASGDNSHTEGANSVASGDNSHAGGCNTIASHESQTAIGKYNKDVDSLLSVGNGEYDEATSEPVRRDALRVERDGKIYILDEEGNEVLLQELYDDEVQYLMEHKREKAVANSLETYGLEAHGFILGWSAANSSIDNPVVGEFVPLYRVKSVNNGKAQVGFTVVSRDNSKGVYKASYYFSSLGDNRVDIIMTHYANHNADSYFSRDCIGFVPIANREWLIVRKVLTSAEDYMVVTDDMKDKNGGYAIISCFTDNKYDSEKQNEADGSNRVILIDSTFSEYEGVNLAENFVPCIDCTGVAEQADEPNVAESVFVSGGDKKYGLFLSILLNDIDGDTSEDITAAFERHIGENILLYVTSTTTSSEDSGNLANQGSYALVNLKFSSMENGYAWIPEMLLRNGMRNGDVRVSGGDVSEYAVGLGSSVEGSVMTVRLLANNTSNCTLTWRTGADVDIINKDVFWYKAITTGYVHAAKWAKEDCCLEADSHLLASEEFYECGFSAAENEDDWGNLDYLYLFPENQSKYTAYQIWSYGGCPVDDLTDFRVTVSKISASNSPSGNRITNGLVYEVEQEVVGLVAGEEVKFTRTGSVDLTNGNSCTWRPWKRFVLAALNAGSDEEVLVLTQENLNDYYDADTEILQVPAGTKTILFNLPDTKVAAIQMEGVTSGQRITVAGSFVPSQHYSADKNVDGRFSSYLYTYRSGYNMGSNDGRLEYAFEDFMYYYGVWYSKGY